MKYCIDDSGGPMVDYTRKLIEKFKRYGNRLSFFVINCCGKIKNLLVTNKSIKINKNVNSIGVSVCDGKYLIFV